MLRHYDRAGRERWGDFMARFGLGRRARALRASPFTAPLADAARLVRLGQPA